MYYICTMYYIYIGDINLFKIRNFKYYYFVIFFYQSLVLLIINWTLIALLLFELRTRKLNSNLVNDVILMWIREQRND